MCVLLCVFGLLCACGVLCVRVSPGLLFLLEHSSTKLAVNYRAQKAFSRKLGMRAGGNKMLKGARALKRDGALLAKVASMKSNGKMQKERMNAFELACSSMSKYRTTARIACRLVFLDGFAFHMNHVSYELKRSSKLRVFKIGKGWKKGDGMLRIQPSPTLAQARETTVTTPSQMHMCKKRHKN